MAIMQIIIYRAGPAEFPYKRASTGINILISPAEDRQQEAGQPASKRQRTGNEPGTVIPNSIKDNSVYDFTL
jgi:hypothetical protein